MDDDVIEIPPPIHLLKKHKRMDDDIVEIPPPIHLLKKHKRAILHNVIGIDDDDDDFDDDLVIIGEKVSKSNKGKTIEAIHQDVSDYMFFQRGVEYDLGLENSPWYDTQSGAKNDHVMDSSQPSWSLEPNNFKIQGSTRGSSSNLQVKMDTVGYHSSGTKLSSPQLFSQAAPSKKKSAASQRSGRGKPPAATKFRSAQKAGGSSSSHNANFEDEIMRKFQSFKQFDTVSDTSDHHFICENSSMKQFQVYGVTKTLFPEQRPKNWAKKILKEWKILEKDLPDAIFVRVYESRMDLLRAVIIGAEGTPYHDALFFLDLYLPSGYPNVPPRVYFHNPCRSSKLNPNLYPSGSVCVSLLNTWHGSKNECWLPGVSTILQVLVSIQGLVLSTEPFYNNGTYSWGSARGLGTRPSRCYNEEACISSLWTMIHIIRRPPKNFEDFVVEHFVSRAHNILGACKAYMQGAQVGSLSNGGVQDVNVWGKSCTGKFKNSLREPIEELIRELARIGAKDCEKFLLQKNITFSMKTKVIKTRLAIKRRRQWFMV